MSWSNLFFSLDGRIGRRTYWLRFVLPAFVLVLGALVIMPPKPNVVVPTVGLLCLLAGIPVVVKRCHDRNRPVWFLLVGLIPVVGFWWLFVEFGFLRGTLGPNRYGFDPLLPTRPGKGGALGMGQRFRIDGGDGDQAFLSNAGTMRITTADWFPGRIGEFGDAILLQIESGPFAGEFVALTTHVQSPLEDQFAHHGWASTVVHRISNPTATFDGGEKDSLAIGMAAVDRIS